MEQSFTCKSNWSLKGNKSSTNQATPMLIKPKATRKKNDSSSTNQF